MVGPPKVLPCPDKKPSVVEDGVVPSLLSVPSVPAPVSLRNKELDVCPGTKHTMDRLVR